MKKYSAILLALALLLALPQCKKENLEDNLEPGKVFLAIETPSNERLSMDPEVSGRVQFTSGDKLVVASSGTYLGALTHNGTRFEGVVNSPTIGSPIDCYFLGNHVPNQSSTTFTFDIYDQTSDLPVISYGQTTENYADPSSPAYGVPSYYTVYLKNKCALVKFNEPSQAFEGDLCVTGFNNRVQVNFSTGAITFSKYGAGIIRMAKHSNSSNGYWAIVPPQAALSAGGTKSAYSSTWDRTGTRGAVPAISANNYLTEGIDVNLSTNNARRLPGSFYAGQATRYFVNGNVQYIASTGTWKLADNQYDYFGDNGQFSNSTTVDRDLFGWGCTGYQDTQYNSSQSRYQPYSVETTGITYHIGDNVVVTIEGGTFYGPTGPYDLNVARKSDWGYHFRSIGGLQSGLSTMPINEWTYILGKDNDDYSKMGLGTITLSNGNTAKGLVLLPDSWTLPTNCSTFHGWNTEANTNTFSANSYNHAQWAAMEWAGAVFLPATGCRQGTEVLLDPDLSCSYWSSTHSTPFDNNESYAYSIIFMENGFLPGANPQRYVGQSVRLSWYTN